MTPTARSARLSRVALLGVLTLTNGCVFLTPVPPVPLTQAEVNKVEKCQKAVTTAGQKFVSTKLTKLEACAQEVLKWRLRFENGLIDQAEFDAKLEATRTKCRRSYEQITEASTSFVDAVVGKCEEVTAFILGDVLVDYDALRFQALANELDSENPVTSVEQLAGVLCGIKEALVDVALTAQMPRALELLSYLGPEFVTINSLPEDVENPGEGLPNVGLDPRCLLATGPVMLQRLSPLRQRAR